MNCEGGGRGRAAAADADEDEASSLLSGANETH